MSQQRTPHAHTLKPHENRISNIGYMNRRQGPNVDGRMCDCVRYHRIEEQRIITAGHIFTFSSPIKWEKVTLKAYDESHVYDRFNYSNYQLHIEHSAEYLFIYLNANVTSSAAVIHAIVCVTRVANTNTRTLEHTHTDTIFVG